MYSRVSPLAPRGPFLPEGNRSMTGWLSTCSVALPPLRVNRTTWYLPSLTITALSSMIMSSVPTLKITPIFPRSYRRMKTLRKPIHAHTVFQTFMSIHLPKCGLFSLKIPLNLTQFCLAVALCSPRTANPKGRQTQLGSQMNLPPSSFGWLPLLFLFDS